MYTNCFYHFLDNKYYIFDENGEITVDSYSPYCYMKTEEKTDLYTITGVPVKKVKMDESYKKNPDFYEVDIHPEIRLLVDKYYQSDEIPVNRIMYLDIETSSEGGFPDVSAANRRITAISTKMNYEEKYVEFVLDKKSRFTLSPSETVKYIVCKSEKELLNKFVVYFTKIAKPSIVTGWNCVNQNEYIRLTDRLKKLENIEMSDNILNYGDIKNVYPTVEKQEYSIKLSNGFETKTSLDHKFPIFLKEKNKYYNSKTFSNIESVDMRVNDILNNINSKYHMYMQIDRNDNNNNDITYRKLIVDNIDTFLSYDIFDILVSDKHLMNRLKQYRNELNISDRHWWGNGFTKTNIFSYKKLIKYISISDIIDMISRIEILYYTINNRRYFVKLDDVVSYDDMSILGLIYSDGNLSISDNLITIESYDLEMYKGYYGKINKYKKNNNIPNVRKRIKQTKEYSYYRMRFAFSKLFFLIPFIYNSKFKKELNVEMLSSLSYNQFVSFISGEIDGDGSKEKHGISFVNYENEDIRKFHILMLYNNIICNQYSHEIYIPYDEKNKHFFSRIKLYHSNKDLSDIVLRKHKDSKSNISNAYYYDDKILIRIIDVVDNNKIEKMRDITTESSYFNCSNIKTHNCFAFDMPYLYRRIARVLTKSVADSISPVGIVKDFKINFSLKNEVYDGIRIVGVSILDYMILYKKYSINERPMYKLDYIAKVELNRGKVEYEGSLDDLYNNDLNKYIEYNIEDIKIVVDLESKLHYIETAIGMCHKGCIPYDWVFMQSRIIEGAILKYFKLNNLVSTNKKEHGVFKFPGAYVKEPIPGRYKWIYSCDLVSLYPSIIRTLNLSTETKLGKILKEKDGKVEILLGNSNKIVDKSKFEKFLKDNKITRSTNGILYTTSKRGFIPKIIDMWFEERLKYKKLKSDAKKLGNKDDEKKYDIQQYVTKILLNSFYGVLGLSSFRFYDIDNAYAVTSTGQSIIQESDKKIREIYSTLGYDGDSPVAYGDTDSLYTTSYPLLKDKKLSNNDILHFTRCISNIVTNELNKNLKSFASDVLNSSNNFLKFNQEAVCYSVLWTGKKKYAMYILDDEGYVPTKNGNMPSGFKMPDISDLIQLRDYISSNKNISDGSVSFDSINPKFKVKGLDTVKSDFPNSFKNILKEVLISILQFKEKDSILHMIKDFKNSMENLDIVDISIPKGVRNIEGYYDPVSLYKKGAPIHVKSAINYNEFIKKYDLGNKYRFIDSGNKLKFVHLKQNEFNFDTIAFKDDIIPDELKFFIDKYIDRDSIFNSVLINKLQDFWGILGWGELTLVDTNLKKFF